MQAQNSKFDVDFVIKNLRQANQFLKSTGDVPFEPVENVLKELCKLFKDLNSFLSVAFSDVTEKVQIINENRQRFPQCTGLKAFVKQEMAHNLHKYNGKNNSKAPAEDKKYVSTARSLLRMMWLMTFLKTLFEDSLNPKYQKLSAILDHAYDVAFGDNHGWLVRKGAKVAIMASSNKSKLVEAVVGKDDEQLFLKYVKELVELLTPLWETLWTFYRENKIDKLD